MWEGDFVDFYKPKFFLEFRNFLTARNGPILTLTIL